MTDFPLVYMLIITPVIAFLPFFVWRYFNGFHAQKTQDYAKTTPSFDIQEQLRGKMLCEGILYGPNGRVISRFVANMEGIWDGNIGTLHEHFTYDSGRTQSRQWQLICQPDKTIIATAPDIIGVGKGASSGSSLQMKYRIRLPKDAGSHVLDVSDWLYLIENGTIINRSQFKKFGVTVAELIATIRKTND